MNHAPSPDAMNLSQLLAAISDLPLPLGDAVDRPLTGLTLDSRRVKPGDVFIALSGSGTHGLHFASHALAAGAQAVLYEPPVPAGLTPPAAAVAVPELRKQLGMIAARFYHYPSADVHVVGVTGTNGKTSIVQFLVQAWEQLGIIGGSIGTLGVGLGDAVQPTGLTTPDVIQVHAFLTQLRNHGARAVAMEVSSHALDQGRVDGVQFDMAVFTNLSRDHLDYHRDMATYGAAKAMLFQRAEISAAIINLDDDFGRTLATNLSQVMGYSAQGQKQALVRAENIVLDTKGIHFDLWIHDQFSPVHSPLLGRFNIDNLLAVAAVLHLQQHSCLRIANVLSQLQAVPGRMNRLGGAHQPTVVIDYAHTPDALEQALYSLQAHLQTNTTTARLVCVFGCGGQRDRDKRPEMGRIAEQYCAQVFITDDNPRMEPAEGIIADILGGLSNATTLIQQKKVIVQPDRAAAITAAIQHAQANDIVLIAGKGHETYQDIAGIPHPFDDALIAASVLAQRIPA